MIIWPLASAGADGPLGAEPAVRAPKPPAPAKARPGPAVSQV